MASEPNVGDGFVMTGAADPVVRFMRWAILFIVVCIVALAGYAVLAGVLNPPAPRTQAEAILASAEAAVRLDPGNGQAWAQLARAQYLMGERAESAKTIAQARKRVKDRTILWVYNQELDQLVRDGKNPEALKKSTEYVQKDIDFRTEQAEDYLARGINPPLDAQNAENQTTIQLFLLRATAQMNLKKPKDAVVSYDNALRMSPMAADVLALRGWAKLEAGDEKGAKKDFESSLKYLPGNEAATEGLEELEAK